MAFTKIRPAQTGLPQATAAQARATHADPAVEKSEIPRKAGALAPAGWLAVTGLGGLTSYFASMVTAKAAEKFLLRLRGSVFAHVQRLSPDFFAGSKIGDLVTRLSSDIAAVEQLVVSGAVDFTTAAMSAVLFAAAAVEEGLANTALVQAYNQQSAESRRLHTHGLAWMRAKLSQNRATAGYAPLVELVEVVCILGIIALGVWEIAAPRAGGLTEVKDPRLTRHADRLLVVRDGKLAEAR